MAYCTVSRAMVLGTGQGSDSNRGPEVRGEKQVRKPMSQTNARFVLNAVDTIGNYSN